MNFPVLRFPMAELLVAKRSSKSHEYFLTLVATKEKSRLTFASARERAICMLMTRD